MKPSKGIRPVSLSMNMVKYWLMKSELDVYPYSQLVADGKSGNMKLAVGCSYCPYKKVCWPNVRGFAYANGPRYLVEVVNEPQVPEIEVR